MRKSVTWMASTLAGVTLLGGFAGVSLAAGTVNSTNVLNPNNKVSATFWVGHNSGALAKAQIYLWKEFERLHPNIKINLKEQGASIGALAAWEAGDPPNCAEMQRVYVPKYTAAHALVDFTPYINGKGGYTKAQLASFYPSIWSYVRGPGNHQYQLPMDKKDMAIYYNSSIFKKLHLKPPAKWGDIWSLAKTLKSHGYVPIAYTPDQRWWAMMLQDDGGSILNKSNTKAAFNSRQGLEALNFLLSLVNAGYLQVTSGYNYQTEFGAGKVGFLVDATAGYTYDAGAAGGKFVVGGAPIPVGTSGKEYAWTNGLGFVLFNTGTQAQKNACFQFMKWMTLPAQNAYWVEHTDYLPTSKAAYDLVKPYFAKNPAMAAAMPPLLDNTLSFRSPKTPAWPEVANVLVNMVQSVLLKQKAPQPALHQAAAQVDAILSGKSKL